jgi:hypothetical protein
VILIAFLGPPFALTADWNVNQSHTDSCKDAKDGRILATAVPVYVVTGPYPRREAGPTLYPVDVPTGEPNIIKLETCSYSNKFIQMVRIKMVCMQPCQRHACYPDPTLAN